MKENLLKILESIIRKLAQLTLWRYRPGIIGVTGSVGKTSTKMAIAEILKYDRDLRFSKGNFNNEIGLPLTILGGWGEIRGTFFWLKVIFSSLLNAFAPLSWIKKKYPELLVLEYAADRPGDIRRLLTIARPNISIITAIGEIPVHIEFYAGSEEVAREKGRLIEYLPSAGFAVLNYDDETVMALKDRTRANVITFGFARGADMRIANFETKSAGFKPLGISFKLEYGGSVVPIRIDKVFGRAQAYASAAAACVGVIFGLNLVKISEALKNYVPATGRMRLVAGQNSTYILDDSYNASPMSVHAALDTLRDLPAKRKIAVLGDMTEIGPYTIQAHEEIGKIASDVVDVLITVGIAAKLIADSAIKEGFKKKNVYQFNDAGDAIKPIEEMIKKGDLILVKGSHIMRMEEIVEEIQLLEEFILPNFAKQNLGGFTPEEIKEENSDTTNG